MRRIVATALSFILSISFSLQGFAKDPDVKSSRRSRAKIGIESDTERRLGIRSVDARNPVIYQGAEGFFANGVVPKSFSDAQRNSPGWKQFETEIVARVAADQKRSLVKFAVIDTGVDPGNKVARDHIAFKVENGKVVGAGLDLMGNSGYAFPHLLDPWAMLVGSGGLNEDDLIVAPNENPNKYLADLNEKVMVQVMTAIKANPKLANTFFTKMNSKNTNLIGLLRILSYEINADANKQLASTGHTIQPTMKTDSLAGVEKSLFTFANGEWIMSPDSGLPDFFGNFDLERLEGIVELKQTIATIVNEKTDIGRAIFKMTKDTARYFRAYHFDYNDPLELVYSYTFEKISMLIAQNKLGSQVHHPAYSFYLSLRKIKARAPQLTWDQIIESALGVYKSVILSIQQDKVTQRRADEMKKLNAQLLGLDQVRKFILSAVAGKNIDSILAHIDSVGSLPWVPDESSINRQYSLRVKHHLLHSSSMDQDHGTHVATTPVAYVGDNYRILPYKIGLGYIKAPPSVEKPIVKRNLDAMFEWFQKPVVARSLFDLLANEAKVELMVDVNTTDGRLKLAEFMKVRFESYLQRDISASGIVGQELHWNLVTAITDVTKEKAAVGNLSLGGGFTEPEYYPTTDTDEEKIGATLDFIFGEFQKYTVADAITTIGKNTLYFMAAGNENQISDGFTRTNYPADLRSPWLSNHKKDGDDPLPGENLKNIVIVGSLNAQGRPSTFTNEVMTDGDVFQIRGENIRSSTMTFNMTGAETVLQARFPEIFRTQMHLASLNTQDSRVAAALQALQLPPEDYNTFRTLIIQAIEMNVHTLKLQNNDQMAVKSGTSMASPEEASKAIAKLVDYLNASKLLEADAYGKPGYTPTDLVAALKKDGIFVSTGQKSRLQYYSFAGLEKLLPPSEIESRFIAKLNTLRGETKNQCLKIYSGAGSK